MAFSFVLHQPQSSLHIAHTAASTAGGNHLMPLLTPVTAHPHTAAKRHIPGSSCRLIKLDTCGKIILWIVLADPLWRFLIGTASCHGLSA